MKRGSFFVLMFHGIVTKKPDHFLYRPSENCFVREKDFEKIIRYCKKKYRILKLTDLDPYFAGTATEDGVLITFDDGLQSLLSLGLPVLKKYGATATVFITPGWTNSGEEPAIFSLEYYLYSHEPALVNISAPGFLFEKKVTKKGDIAMVIGELWDTLFEEKISPLSLTADQILINQKPLTSFVKDASPANWKPVSWDLLRKAFDEGIIEIGAHGQTHTPFSWLTNEALENECDESRRQLLSHFNTPVSSCSFPHGLYDERTANITSKHFKYCFVNNVVINNGLPDKTTISRYNVPYQRPNNIPSLISYPFLGKVLRKFGHLSKWY
jgi:peptidoglycan/xylan/chitin deacetylase (PgdA/CDA1 family)